MTQAAVIKVGPTIVHLISKDDRIVGSLKTRGPFEPQSLETWAIMCSQGGTVIDVGAYTGLYTIGARKLGARCIAFEPMPANRMRARENCRFNEVDDSIHEEAISDKAGPGELHHTDVAMTSGASLVRKSGRNWPVEMLTIDSLNLQSLRAMKIDVERAEPMVLRGARDTLQRCRPELLVEVLGDKEGKAVLDELAGLNYRHAATLDERNWLLMPE
jgi:FkbM family methyltransferase